MKLLGWIHQALLPYAFVYLFIGFIMLCAFHNIQAAIIFIISLFLAFITIIYLLKLIDEYANRKSG